MYLYFWNHIEGVVQFTVWEALYVYCCATNRISFMSDEEAASSPKNILMFILSFFWVPLYREFHFYFAHRWQVLLKIIGSMIFKLDSSIFLLFTSTSTVSIIGTLILNPLQVGMNKIVQILNSLGLSMHPIEHLYYYSCLGPSFLVYTTPFAFM